MLLRRSRCVKIFTAASVLAIAGLVAALQSAGARPVRQAVERPLIYSADPDDPWNGIFACLFTRRFEARLSDDFDAGAPFTDFDPHGLQRPIHVSTRLFERFEEGDRAIEPLYPSFITDIGPAQVVSDPLYSRLKEALTEALKDKTARPALDRALMQCDVWAAHDILFRQDSLRRAHPSSSDSLDVGKRTSEILSLLGRFVEKLALSPGEIVGLPDNYDAAIRAGLELPRLFDRASGWIEIRWFPDRLHDYAASFRRAARIFILPSSPPRDKQEFLNSLRRNDGVGKVDAVALVVQNLLVDAAGRVTPSRLTYDVQVRHFVKDARGALLRTDPDEYELSRRLLLSGRGAFARFDAKAPAYLSDSGNDYEFASLIRDRRGRGSPIVASLRSRCAACHGQNLDGLMTFSKQEVLPEPVAELNPSRYEHALYVASRKMASDDFKALSTHPPVR